MRVKEFRSFKRDERIVSVGQAIDSWLKDNPVTILDIKYSANNFGSHALVIFEVKNEDNTNL